MNENLPAILDKEQLPGFNTLSSEEINYILRAKKLLDLGFPDHSLLDIWNAAVHSLRRRVEIYSVDLFISAVKDEGGRKSYKKDGETINERWDNVDDSTLITGATRLGILSKKAGKALEMINWMRNHSTPAHGSDSQVEADEVVGLVLILQRNLFEADMPDPGHSPSGLFEPIKTTYLDEDNIVMLREQIKSFRPVEIRTTFGFMIDMICSGEEPAFSNTKKLFAEVWERSNDDLKRNAGHRYHSYILDPDADESADKGSKIRLLETLVSCEGIKYIPDAARASLYRRAVKALSKAKNTQYGWDEEEKAARALSQFGPYVPMIAFEQVYQEILSVWCGNYWGRSNAWSILSPFVETLNTTQLMRLINMFSDNEKVREELFNHRPKNRAIALLEEIKGKLSIQTNIDEVDAVIEEINSI